jgi:hypothetical protein
MKSKRDKDGRKTRCDKNGMCHILADRCDGSWGDRKKGFFACNAMFKNNPENNRFVGVAYRKGPGDKGLLLNFCPWCGGTPGREGETV